MVHVVQLTTNQPTEPKPKPNPKPANRCYDSYTASVKRVRLVAPNVGLLTFSSMAGVIMERDCTAQNNRALANLVVHWGARNVQIVSDQHVPAMTFTGVGQTIRNMTAMVTDMRTDKKAYVSSVCEVQHPHVVLAATRCIVSVACWLQGDGTTPRRHAHTPRFFHVRWVLMKPHGADTPMHCVMPPWQRGATGRAGRGSSSLWGKRTVRRIKTSRTTPCATVWAGHCSTPGMLSTHCYPAP